MGCCFSCSSSSTFKNIRVVHLNGYVEDYEHPVTVSQVTGKLPKHFVCTPTQLLTTGSRPLKPHIELKPGNIYFILPYSTFQSDVSPMDLASVVRKLTTIAKTSRSNATSPRSDGISSQYGSSPIWGSPARSPNRFSEEMGVAAYGALESSKARSWRPLLDTIRERSFNRRSESDLQEKHLEMPK